MQKPDMYIVGVILLLVGSVEVIALVLAGGTSEAVAAWVQAIGSLLALVIAIALPAHALKVEAERKRKEKVVRAEQLTVLLIGEVRALRDRAAILQLRVATYADGRDVAWRKTLELQVPERLADAVFDKDVDLMAMKPLVNILMIANAYNTFVNDILSTTRPEGAAGASVLMSELEKRRVLVEKFCTELMNDVSARA